MKKIITGILFLFLAISVKVHGMTLYSTFDTNSTEGDYYGSIYFSFSSTNSSDYNSGDMEWNNATDSQTFTDAVTGAQISIFFQASGFGARDTELDFVSVIKVSDPGLGAIEGGLGNGYGGSDSYNSSPGEFNVGQSSMIDYETHDVSYYYSYLLNTNGICNFGCSLTGYFDGTSGSAVGSWYIDYSPIAVPEPAISWQVALGGFCLWVACARVAATS